MCPPYSQVVWGFKYLLFLHQTVFFFFFCGTLPGGLGKSNGNPLQCCCWRIPWTEEPGGLQSRRSQKVGHN